MSGFQRDLHHVLAHLESAQRVARLGSWELDLGRDVLHWSENMFDLLARTTREVPTMRQFVGCFDEQDRAKFLSAVDAARRGESSESFVLRSRNQDGPVRLLRNQIDVTLNSHGAPEFLLGTMVDCTDEVVRSEDLAQIDARRRELLGAVLAGTDERRNRVANHLHDGPVQLLAVAALRLEALDTAGEPDASRTVSSAVDALRTAVAELRDVLVALQPALLRHGGAVRALEALADGRGEIETNVRCHIDVDPDPAVLGVLLGIVSDVLTALDTASTRSVMVRYSSGHDGQLVELDLVGRSDGIEPMLGPLVETSAMARAALAGGVVSVSAGVDVKTLRVRVPRGLLDE